jgi:hypothetical protein
MIKKLQAVPGREKAVMFELKRTDSNRDLWSVLYANKKFRMAAKPEACKDDTNDRIYVTAGLEDGTQLGPSTIACLEYFPNVWSTWLPPTGAVLLIGATLLLAWKTSMLRDPGVQPNGEKTPWSLARCQMTLWFVTVVCAVLFAYAVTGDISPIPGGVLILMGIGAGTAVSGFAMDASRIPGSRADYEAAKRLQPALDETVVDANGKVSAAKAANPPDPKLPVLETSLVDAKKAADENRAKVRQFEVPATRSLFYDVMSDSNGIAFHRLQVFAWTMTYWFIFIVALFHKITLTNFDPTQLGLMGISGATYLGFKLQEQPKQPGNGPANG